MWPWWMWHCHHHWSKEKWHYQQEEDLTCLSCRVRAGQAIWHRIADVFSWLNLLDISKLKQLSMVQLIFLTPGGRSGYDAHIRLSSQRLAVWYSGAEAAGVHLWKHCPSVFGSVICSNTSITRKSATTFRNLHLTDQRPLTVVMKHHLGPKKPLSNTPDT